MPISSDLPFNYPQRIKENYNNEKNDLGISVMISGILLICAALIGGGMIVGGVNTVGAWPKDIFDSGVAVNFTIIGSLLAVFGAVLAFMEAFNKKQ